MVNPRQLAERIRQGGEAAPTNARSPLRESARDVLSTLRQAGFQAFFAGGCVRDEVLGLEPKDWDIATSAKPDEVMALFEKSIPVGVAFGVVRVIVRGFEYEVATFRADGDYADHRRPSSVSWASAREDVLRRDFTINGLLSDPFAPDGAQVVDYVGGLADLERGLIRAIGTPQARFEEDYLRMLRAVRFAARFSFAIDPATFDAVAAMGSRIIEVSAERIGQELDRLVSEGGQAVGVTLLAKTGLLFHILPEFSDGLALGPDAVPDAVAHAATRLTRIGRCEPVFGWALLLWDRPETVEPIAKRLRMSRAAQQQIGEIVTAGHQVGGWDTLTVAEQKRLLRLPRGPDAVAAAGIAGHTEASEQAKEALRRWDGALRPTPFITGADLKAAGFSPGPAFAKALFAVEDAQLEDRVTDREGALALARTLLRGSQPQP